MNNFTLTPSLNSFVLNVDLQPVGIGCSGDNVVKIIRKDGVYFLKYSANPNIKQEYTKLKWLQRRLPVPEIISYEEQDGIYYLLTRSLDGEMVCSPYYMKNWQTGLDIVHQAFNVLWKTDFSDCPFDTGLNYKLQNIKNKLDNNLIHPNDIRSEYIKKFGDLDGMYKYLIDNRPAEQLCFSHGDTSLPNIFGKNETLTGFIDVANCGIADIWYDIAVTAKSVKRNYGSQALDFFYDIIKTKTGVIKQDIIEYYTTLIEF